MTEKRAGRNGDNFMWTLTLGMFALGALSLFLSFGGTGGGSGASLDDDALAAASVRSDAMGDSEEGDFDTDGEDNSAAANPGGGAAADRFTISASGDILIHERVAEAAQTGENTYDFAPLFAPVQNLIASRDFALSLIHI